MVYRGHIEKGSVVLDESVELADGLEVEVRVLSSAIKSNGATRRPWMEFAGKVSDLPADASITVDQVLYGRPAE